MAKKDEDKVDNEGAATVDAADGPLLDLNDAAVKRMIKLAKKRGFVTYAELNAVLPSEEVSSDQIEDVYAMLSEMGITVSEGDDPDDVEEEQAAEEEEAEGGELVESPRSSAVATRTSEPADRTDDPVRMYLREMGSVELLSREGEIAIAKRIEAGREAMIAGLCESPLTFQAIIIWREELEAGKVLLRDIIDLEATYAGPRRQGRRQGAGRGGRGGDGSRHRAAHPAGRHRRDAPAGRKSFEDDDDMENSLSLSAMEAELKPKVLETFARVADAYKKLRACRIQNVENKLKNETLTPRRSANTSTLKKEIVTDVKSLSLNQNRIEALVEQLYDINKRLIGYETKLLRLADSYGVAREDFIDKFHGSELDPKWVMRVAQLKSKGWKEFVADEKDRIKDLRAEIHALATETGWKFPSSARSCTWCRRASARPGRPRRKWSRPTCASSSRSPRNTPTAACSSSTSSRKATSA